MVKALGGGNRHSVNFYDWLRNSVTAPGAPEDRPATRSPYMGPVGTAAMAAQIASDPEFAEWRAEERAADLGMLTRRAHR